MTMMQKTIRGFHCSTMVAIALWAAMPALAQDPSGATPVAVQGILISPNGRSALIGGQLAREGETVRGARVAEISESSVVLHRGDSALTVPVGGSGSWTNAVPIRSVAQREPARRATRGADPSSTARDARAANRDGGRHALRHCG